MQVFGLSAPTATPRARHYNGQPQANRGMSWMRWSHFLTNRQTWPKKDNFLFLGSRFFMHIKFFCDVFCCFFYHSKIFWELFYNSSSWITLSHCLLRSCVSSVFLANELMWYHTFCCVVGGLLCIVAIQLGAMGGMRHCDTTTGGVGEVGYCVLW